MCIIVCVLGQLNYGNKYPRNKDRIASVEKTNKITQAMKMVSAAKFKRNIKQLDHVKEYGEGLESIITSLSRRLFDDEIPALLTPNDSPQVAMIIISSDRGLCGGFNANLFKTFRDAMAKHSQVDAYIIGNKAHQHYKSKDVNIVGVQSGFKSTTDLSEITSYINGFVNSYLRAFILMFTLFIMSLYQHWHPIRSFSNYCR